ncbi:MarR family transcriptional regulator [Staphylococcus gallinarum]|uniref:MarR family transcriptional regulator n=1 Tax=Staphylococcus gallinarum TaxID=1293 RepID=UPI0030C08531
MDKSEQLLNDIKEVYDKIVWLNKPVMEEHLKGYTPTEVHCIDAIDKLNKPNVSKLSKKLFMTRGAISKLTKKLIDKGAIESFRETQNKKEIYFQLTDKGQEVAVLHASLHNKFRERDKPVFDTVTDEAYDVMLDFLGKYNAHLTKEINDRN